MKVQTGLGLKGDRGVARLGGDLLQKSSKDGERGWVVCLFLEDSDDCCISCEVFTPKGAVPATEEMTEIVENFY